MAVSHIKIRTAWATTGRLKFKTSMGSFCSQQQQGSMKCWETIHQAADHRKADITQPVLMIYEVWYIVWITWNLWGYVEQAL